MRVLVFEPKYVGHFLGFATYAANAYARQGHDVVMALNRDAEGTDQATTKLANLLPEVQVEFCIDMPLVYEKSRNAVLETDALHEALRMLALGTHAPDQLCVPSGDFLLCGLSRDYRLRRKLKSLRGADIILHGCKQAYPQLGKRERFSLIWDRYAVDICRNFRLLCVDPFVKRQAHPRTGILFDPIGCIPHPFDQLAEHRDSSSARREIGLPIEGRIVGSIGDLGTRKGTELLIEGFARVAGDGDAKLALYGLQSASVRDCLARHADLVRCGRIHVRDEFVSDTTFLNFFDAVDLLWACYPRHIGIASVLLFAADAALPVLAAEYGCVGWMTKEYGLGVTSPPTLSAITSALGDWQRRGKAVSSSGRERLLNFHSTATFERELAARPSESGQSTTVPLRKLPTTEQ